MTTAPRPPATGTPGPGPGAAVARVARSGPCSGRGWRCWRAAGRPAGGLVLSPSAPAGTWSPPTTCLHGLGPESTGPAGHARPGRAAGDRRPAGAASTCRSGPMVSLAGMVFGFAYGEWGWPLPAGPARGPGRPGSAGRRQRPARRLPAVPGPDRDAGHLLRLQLPRRREQRQRADQRRADIQDLYSITRAVETSAAWPTCPAQVFTFLLPVAVVVWLLVNRAPLRAPALRGRHQRGRRPVRQPARGPGPLRRLRPVRPALGAWSR